MRLNLCNTDDTPAVSTDGHAGARGRIQRRYPRSAITFDSLVSAIRAGNAYVNVHTSDGTLEEGPGNFPGGEIRGQITPQ